MCLRGGGKCVVHGTVGTKYVEKSRVWTQRKDGTFGWKPKSTTKYVCHYSEVAKSNVWKSGEDGRFGGVAKSDMMSTGIGMEVMKNTALGGKHSNTGGVENLPWVSGDDYRRAGSIESESERRGSMSKDTD